VRQALSLNRVTLPELVATLHRLEGRRGVRTLSKVLVTAAPTRSEFEDIVHDLILSGGFDEPDVNVPLVIEGTTVVPDFRWPGVGVVVEADSRKWHDNPVARADDAERRALLEAAGETVIHVTYRQAVVTPGQTLTRIREAGAPPR
jgi:very-short-patch-repair endonuclease